jgi:hypothetical protein
MNKIKALVFSALLAPVAIAATVMAVNVPKKHDFKFADEPAAKAPAAVVEASQTITLPEMIVVGGPEQPTKKAARPAAKAPQKSCKLQLLKNAPQSMVLVCDIERTANDRLTTLRTAPAK